MVQSSQGGWAKNYAGYSGNGLRQIACSRASGNWISNLPHYWFGRDFVKVIQLRGNLLPTRSISSKPPNERICRKGWNDRIEFLIHIFQRCSIAHWGRIIHNIVKLGRTIAEKRGWIVESEPRICCSNGMLRIPDFALRMGNRVLVTDIGISWKLFRHRIKPLYIVNCTSF